MKASFLTHRPASKRPKANIFANRSSVILHDLLLADQDDLTIQSVARKAGVSVGLTHRVITELVYRGYVQTEGVRTAKTHRLVKPAALCRLWMDSYDITEKCRFYTYESSRSPQELEQELLHSKLSKSAILALHSACRQYGCSFTNLNTLELYLRDAASRPKIEKLFRLEPKERGYKVLLIEPYYSKLLESRSDEKSGLPASSPLLSFLDLYHFPLRGQEQAEHLLRRHPTLAKISAAFLKEKDHGRKFAR
jgi:hypothetical protein